MLIVLAVAVSAGMVRLFVDVSPRWLAEGYQPSPMDLGPAAMYAVGAGFSMPDDRVLPGVNEFLQMQQAKLAKRAPTAETEPIPAQGWFARHGYLLRSLGMLWRWLGLSWNVVKILLAGMYVALALAAYGLFRLGMNRVFSAAAAVAFLLSPGVIAQLPSLRDFSKAPFILACLLALGLLVKTPVRRRVFFALSASLGLVLGIGIGFRHDVVICLPAALLVIAFCARPQPGRALIERGMAIALMLVVYQASSWPIRQAYGNSGAPLHDIHMGLSTECEDRLGLGRASYERMPLTLDPLVHAAANSYARRVEGFSGYLTYDCPEQEAVRKKLFLHIGTTFPADMLARVQAAVLWVVRGALPGGETPTWLTRHFARFGLAYAAAAVLLLGAHSYRTALLASLLFVYFCGYITLQFQFRHCFHLAFVPLWLAGFVADKVFWGLAGVAEPRRRAAWWRRLRSPGRWRGPVTRRVAFTAIAGLFLVFAPFYVARALQHVRISRLADTYTTAVLQPLATDAAALDDWTVFRPSNRMATRPHRPGTRGWQFEDDYLMAEFKASPEPRSFWVRYETETGQNDFSYRVCLGPTGAANGERVQYFFPIYECVVPGGHETFGWRGNATNRWSYFAGIAFAPDDAADFAGFARVLNKEDYPLYLHFAVPNNRDFLAPHQRLPIGTVACPEAERGMLDPKRPDRTAHSLRAQGQFERAIEHYRGRIEAVPESIGLNAGLGDALSAMNRFDEAEAAYEAAVKIDPAFFIPRYGLAKLFDKKGEASHARTAYRLAAALNPSDPGIEERLALMLVARQDYYGAIEAYRRARELDYRTVALFGGAAEAFCAVGRFHDAAEAYHNAHLLDPAYGARAPEELGGAASLFEARGDLRRAASGYRAALEFAPGEAQWEEALARCEKGKE